MVDVVKIGQHSGFFSAVIILSATSIELLKLFPWRNTMYDGFPHMRTSVHVTPVALVEDVPQLVIQIIFVSELKWSTIAVVSLALTGLTLLWRVLKRFLRLVALNASTMDDARMDQHVVDKPPSKTSGERGGQVYV
jgi:hypothetical protein